MAIGTATALIGSAIIGGALQHSGSRRAARAQERGNQAAIDEQRAAREQFFARTQPFVDIGLSAGEQLQALLNNPQAGLDEINPVVDILRNQGFEQIQESAAAGGRLGAGGTLKDLTQFNTDLTTTVIPQLQNQRFNQLFNVLGLGQNAATGQGTAALQTGANISGFQQGIGNARAGGIVGSTNALTGMLSNIGSAFGAQPSGGADMFSDQNLYGESGAPSFTMPTFAPPQF